MADKLIVNSNIGISKTPEASPSAIKTLAADYVGAVTNALNIQIPNIEKILNAGLIGDGDEWASQSDPDYAVHTGMTFADRLNTTQFAILAARTLSGEVTSTEVDTGSGVYDHVIEMQASDEDPQLDTSSVAFELGGFDFILGGMVGNNLSVSLQGGAAPTYSVEQVGTGYFEYMSDQTPALELPSPSAQDYVGQRSQSSVELSDGTVWDISGAGRVDSVSLDFTNNVITGERRVGDPLIDNTDDNTGAYVRYLTRGDQRNLTLALGVYLSDDQRGYAAHVNNSEITDFKYKSVGNREIGSTGFYHEVEFIVPRAIVTSVALGGDRKGIYTLNIEPLKKDGEDGIFKIRIRNNSATLA